MVLELTKLEYQKKWYIPMLFGNSVSGQIISKIDGNGPFCPSKSTLPYKRTSWTNATQREPTSAKRFQMCFITASPFHSPALLSSNSHLPFLEYTIASRRLLKVGAHMLFLKFFIIFLFGKVNRCMSIDL